MGVCYEKGKGVKANAAAAAQWYEKSAKQGYPPAQMCLALCYEKGKGVKKDKNKATYWHDKADPQADTIERLLSRLPKSQS